MMSEMVGPDVRQRESESTLPGDHMEDPAPRLFIWGSAPAPLRAPCDASSDRSCQFDGAGAVGEWVGRVNEWSLRSISLLALRALEHCKHPGFNQLSSAPRARWTSVK